MTNFTAGAEAQLDRIRSVVRGIGWQFSDLQPTGLGVGLAIAWGQENFVVISISGGSDSHAYLTSGVVQSIRQDKLAVLDVCNTRNSNNPEFTYFLHDAEIGWDVLIQNYFPVQLLVDVPPFFEMIAQGTASVAEQMRPEFQQLVGGGTYSWVPDDVNRVFQTSLI